MIIISTLSLPELVTGILCRAMQQEHVSPRRTQIEYSPWVTSNTSEFKLRTSSLILLADLVILHVCSYIWNAADNAAAYVKLTFGVFFSELAQNFKLFEKGAESYLLRFYVGHDGSMIRLAAGLGLGRTKALRWPALGSEIVMEVSMSQPPFDVFDQ